MSELASLALAHLRLTSVAIAAASLIGLAAGVAARRDRRVERVVVGAASLVQTIPAIALLAVMVPLLAWLGERTGLAISSIGELPALIALSLYALLPIARGLIMGMRAIDPAILQAARAVGMTPAEQLWRVELPLAGPFVIAGLRTATVWTVGMATLATPVGGRSLGNLIFAGLQTRHFDDVLIGCGAAAALAIALDSGLALAEQRARRPGGARAVGLVLGVIAAVALASLAIGAIPAIGPRPVRVGAKSFTEQLVLAEIVRCALGPGVAVEVRPSLGTTVAFDGLRAGDLDVYVEYTGTAWTTILEREGAPEREAMQREITAALRRDHRVDVLARLGFENAYALVVRGEHPARRISDLGSASELAFGGDYELFERAEWATLRARYGLEPRETRAMDPSLLYEGLRAGAVDVIGGYTTDGRVQALGLRVLEDDRAAIPPYDAIVLGGERLRREPALARRLRALEGTIDAAAMRAMNHAVDSGAQTPAEAARAHAACRAQGLGGR
jgi:osmoprotectant transport system permease protein